MTLGLAFLAILVRQAFTQGYERFSYADLMHKTRKVAEENEDIFEYLEGHSLYSDVLPESICNGEKMQFPIIRATNFRKSREEINKLPHVFLIGPIHGDEIVGAHVLVYFLYKLAAEKHGKFWDLLNTRMLIILPSSNTQGFCMNKRENNGLDANRDFPYAVSPQACMITPSSRIVNEIVRDHLIVSAVVFHGGDNSITYPWGNNKHGPISPDNIAFSAVASELQKVTGFFPKLNIQQYRIGTMTEVVYPVDGGLEDWIYGASWDKDNIPVCAPSTAPHYPPEKTQYNDYTNRGFIYLVEAGWDKEPDSSTFGKEKYWDNQGHVSRNMLLVERIAELTRPEVFFQNWTYDKSNDSGEITFIPKGCLLLDEVTLIATLWSESQGRKEVKQIVENCKQAGVPCSSVVEIHGEKMASIRVEIKCDSNWARDPSPESHMVRLRTKENYYAKNKEYYITNERGFSRSTENFAVSNNRWFSTISQDFAASHTLGLRMKAHHIGPMNSLWFPKELKFPIKNLELVIESVQMRMDSLNNEDFIYTIRLEDQLEALKIDKTKNTFVAIYDLLDRNSSAKHLIVPVKHQTMTFELTAAQYVGLPGKVLELQEGAYAGMTKTHTRYILADNTTAHSYAGTIGLPVGEFVLDGKTLSGVIFCLLPNKDEEGNRVWEASVTLAPIMSKLSEGKKIEIRDSEDPSKILFTATLEDVDLKTGIVRLLEDDHSPKYGHNYALYYNGKLLGESILFSGGQNSKSLEGHKPSGYIRKRQKAKEELQRNPSKGNHSILFAFLFVVGLTLLTMGVVFWRHLKKMDSQMRLDGDLMKIETQLEVQKISHEAHDEQKEDDPPQDNSL